MAREKELPSTMDVETDAAPRGGQRGAQGLGDSGAFGKRTPDSSAEASLGHEPPPRSSSELERWGTMIPPGATLSGRYRIDWFIARGGMGEVYAAYDRELGDRIALKTMNSALAGDPEGLAALKAEVSLARKVSHSNVCRIHDLGVHAVSGYPNLMFLTMEFVDGESLGSRLQREGQLSEMEAVQLAGGMLSGLAAAHEAGVLHRDLKSDNIMLRKRAGGGVTPVIMDFGLASALNPNSSRISGDHALVGSLGYMAPEQVQGDVLRAVTDVYSLGVILFEMLTGRLPFRASTPALAALKRLRELAPQVRSIRPELSTEVERIVARALQPRPYDRYRSALEMLHEIEALPYYRRSIPPPSPAPDLTTTQVGAKALSLTTPSANSAHFDELAADFDLALLLPVGEPVVGTSQPFEPRPQAVARAHDDSRRGLDLTLRSGRAPESRVLDETSSGAPSHAFKSEPSGNTSLPTFVAVTHRSQRPYHFKWTFVMASVGALIGGGVWLAATRAPEPHSAEPLGRVSIGGEIPENVTPIRGARPLVVADPRGGQVSTGTVTSEPLVESLSSSGAVTTPSTAGWAQTVPMSDASQPRVHRPERKVGGVGTRAPRTGDSSQTNQSPVPSASESHVPVRLDQKKPTIVYPPELRPQRRFNSAPPPSTTSAP